MKCRRAALAMMVFLDASVFLAGFSCRGALALTQDTDVNSYIAKAPIPGVPPGSNSYSQWSEGQRKTAFGRIRGFCQFLCVDKYSGASFKSRAAAERTMTEAKVCLEACIVNHLPPDYPGLAGLKQQLHADYGKVRQLGSPIPWPLPGK